jgi:hypothetical protein
MAFVFRPVVCFDELAEVLFAEDEPLEQVILYINKRAGAFGIQVLEVEFNQAAFGNSVFNFVHCAKIKWNADNAD